MTYKDVINRFEDVANAHYMIKDFGYGQLSDIKAHSQDHEADYPYLFLNPTPHTRSGIIMEYNFNMIMMDIAVDEDDDLGNWIAIQSQCQQYIDDVIAELYYGYTDKPEIDYTNVTYTPFKERFQDSLAGMTASITIKVPTPINQCIAPIEPEPAACSKTLTVFSDSTNNVDNLLDADVASSWRWETNTLETPAIGMFNDIFFSNAVTGDFELYISSDITFIEPVAGETLPQPPVLKSLFSSFPDTPATCDSGNWPTEWTADTITYTAKYNITLNELTSFGVVQFVNQPSDESAIIQRSGGTLTIGFS